MKDERHLSRFQETTEAALVAALAEIGLSLTARRIEGANETFIRANVRNTDAEVFIYQNEAGVLGPNVDKRFEAVDYRDGDTLAGAFIEQTVDYAKRYAPHS